MIINIVMLLIVFFCVAMMWNEGLWSNALTFLNTTAAAIIATNYFEPAASFLDKQAPSFTYMWDFLMLWAIFLFSQVILRTATDQISKVRVRFKLPVDMAGKAIFALLTSWVMICFSLMTLHTAPLARKCIRGSFQPTPTYRNFLGTGADRLWMGFMQQESRGTLSAKVAKSASPYKADANKRVFDPKGEFIVRYASRRENFSKQKTMRVQKKKSRRRSN